MDFVNLFFNNLREDIIAHVPPDHRNKAAISWMCVYLKIIMLSRGFHLILIYRITHLLRCNFGVLGKICSSILFAFSRQWYSSEISPLANIAGGIIFPHPRNITIGAETIIGPRSWIFQNVTIGGSPGKVGLPIIGSDGRIYTGAVISGPIKIGNHVSIGANTVVSQDLADGVFARPGKPTISKSSQYSLDVAS
ncbi:hypothetical protein QGP82_14335 [Leptothoe sp. LEGE 181152]|nr:hypothetical protein [Leptothoe sp. LEGE 181152]